MSFYDNESIVIVPYDYYDNKYIISWEDGSPLKYKYGYELKRFDPQQIIVTVDYDNVGIEGHEFLTTHPRL